MRQVQGKEHDQALDRSWDLTHANWHSLPDIPAGARFHSSLLVTWVQVFLSVSRWASLHLYQLLRCHQDLDSFLRLFQLARDCRLILGLLVYQEHPGICQHQEGNVRGHALLYHCLHPLLHPPRLCSILSRFIDFFQQYGRLHHPGSKPWSNSCYHLSVLLCL